MSEFNVGNKIRILTGFNAFQARCKFVSWQWRDVAIENGKPKSMNVPFCSQHENRVMQKGKAYLPVCRKEICPYYRKEIRE